jgi:hypothetical protein
MSEEVFQEEESIWESNFLGYLPLLFIPVVEMMCFILNKAR